MTDQKKNDFPKPPRLRGELPVKVDLQKLLDQREQAEANVRVNKDRVRLAEEALKRAEDNLSFTEDTYGALVNPVLMDLISKAIAKHKGMFDNPSHFTFNASEKTNGWWLVRAIHHSDPNPYWMQGRSDPPLNWRLKDTFFLEEINIGELMVPSDEVVCLAEIHINVLSGETSFQRNPTFKFIGGVL